MRWDCAQAGHHRGGPLPVHPDRACVRGRRPATEAGPALRGVQAGDFTRADAPQSHAAPHPRHHAAAGGAALPALLRAGPHNGGAERQRVGMERHCRMYGTARRQLQELAHVILARVGLHAGGRGRRGGLLDLHRPSVLGGCLQLRQGRATHAGHAAAARGRGQAFPAAGAAAPDIRQHRRAGQHPGGGDPVRDAAAAAPAAEPQLRLAQPAGGGGPRHAGGRHPGGRRRASRPARAARPVGALHHGAHPARLHRRRARVPAAVAGLAARGGRAERGSGDAIRSCLAQQLLVRDRCQHRRRPSSHAPWDHGRFLRAGLPRGTGPRLHGAAGGGRRHAADVRVRREGGPSPGAVVRRGHPECVRPQPGDRAAADGGAAGGRVGAPVARPAARGHAAAGGRRQSLAGQRCRGGGAARPAGGMAEAPRACRRGRAICAVRAAGRVLRRPGGRARVPGGAGGADGGGRAGGPQGGAAGARRHGDGAPAGVVRRQRRASAGLGGGGGAAEAAVGGGPAARPGAGPGAAAGGRPGSGSGRQPQPGGCGQTVRADRKVDGGGARGQSRPDPWHHGASVPRSCCRRRGREDHLQGPLPAGGVRLQAVQGAAEAAGEPRDGDAAGGAPGQDPAAGRPAAAAGRQAAEGAGEESQQCVGPGDPSAADTEEPRGQGGENGQSGAQ
mmetsp:Transcript_10141/g.25805  ORF Transcript_10141/g.25805 Transcript_10141/m.25805 type:complete len:674 (-) Transcript_10141:2127-4148(-)